MALPRHQCFPGNGPEKSSLLQGPAKPEARSSSSLNKQDAAYDFIGYEGNAFWFQTDLNAPRGRIVAVDSRNRTGSRRFVPEAADKLEGVDLVGDRFIASYLKDAHSVVRVFELSGKPAGRNSLPGTRDRERFHRQTQGHARHFTPTSASPKPRTVFRYDMKTGQSTVLFRPKVDFKPDELHDRTGLLQSKDGTRVPMFMTYQKGLEKTAQPDAALRLWRIQYFDHALFRSADLRLAGNGRRLRGGEPARRRRIRREWHLAGTKLQEAKCLR